MADLPRIAGGRQLSFYVAYYLSIEIGLLNLSIPSGPRSSRTVSLLANSAIYHGRALFDIEREVEQLIYL
ncbi:hypothetical protein BDW68DRAFT_156630 [Aspergillus falconensis]